jgi:hypothetical protein
MSELKRVEKEGFEDRNAAFGNARAFRAIGGKVVEGGERADGSWGWSGEIRVDDALKSVSGTFHCGRCAGSGQFVTYVENGKPRGPGGICFRCGGNGRHTQEDRKRNYWHDMFYFAQEARRMMSA